MKKLLGICLIITVFAGGFTASALTPVSRLGERTEQFSKAQMSDKKDKKDFMDKKGNKDLKGFKGNKDFTPSQQGKAHRPDLFEGITLSQEQQKQLEALKAEHKPQKGQEKGKKDQKSKDERENRRAEFNAKVKEILTPEQWTVYQQNLDKMKANRPRKNNHK